MSTYFLRGHDLSTCWVCDQYATPRRLHIEYTIDVPEFLGEISTLDGVARAMAKKSASAGDKGFHKPAYEGALRGFTLALITEARSGRLKVCNRFGTCGMPDEIINNSKLEGPIVEVESDANLTTVLNVFVSLTQLNAWAKERGDVFRINHNNAPWIDERGWNNVDGEPPALQITVEPVPASVPQPRPVGVVHASDGLEPVNKFSAKSLPEEGGNGISKIALQDASHPWLVADARDPAAEYPWYTPARYFPRLQPFTIESILPGSTNASVQPNDLDQRF